MKINDTIYLCGCGHKRVSYSKFPCPRCGKPSPYMENVNRAARILLPSMIVDSVVVLSLFLFGANNTITTIAIAINAIVSSMLAVLYHEKDERVPSIIFFLLSVVHVLWIYLSFTFFKG